MSEVEKTKIQAIETLKHLCARCKDNEDHICPVKGLIREIAEIRGIPIFVNDRLYHVMFN